MATQETFQRALRQFGGIIEQHATESEQAHRAIEAQIALPELKAAQHQARFEQDVAMRRHIEEQTGGILGKLEEMAPPEVEPAPSNVLEGVGIGFELSESLHYTPAVLAATLQRQARKAASGDGRAAAYLERAVPLHRSRLEVKDFLQKDAKVSNALIDAEQALANLPARVARRQHLELVAEARSELAHLSKVLRSRTPVADLDAYKRSRALPLFFGEA